MCTRGCVDSLCLLLPPRSSDAPAKKPKSSNSGGSIPPVSSTVKGVSFDKPTNKWLVRFSEGGQQKYLGRYATQEEAETKANETKIKASSTSDSPGAVPAAVEDTENDTLPMLEDDTLPLPDDEDDEDKPDSSTEPDDEDDEDKPDTSTEPDDEDDEDGPDTSTEPDDKLADRTTTPTPMLETAETV